MLDKLLRFFFYKTYLISYSYLSKGEVVYGYRIENCYRWVSCLRYLLEFPEELKLKIKKEKYDVDDSSLVINGIYRIHIWS